MKWKCAIVKPLKNIIVRGENRVKNITNLLCLYYDLWHICPFYINARKIVLKMTLPIQELGWVWAPGFCLLQQLLVFAEWLNKRVLSLPQPLCVSFSLSLKLFLKIKCIQYFTMQDYSDLRIEHGFPWAEVRD